MKFHSAVLRMPLLIGAMLLLIFAFGTERVDANPYGTAPVELDAGVLQDCAFFVADGNVNCWGNANVYGTTDDYLGGDAIGFGSGDWTNCVLLPDGNTYCWGYKADNNPQGEPDQLSYTGGDAVRVSVGYGHACVLTSAGNVNCAGTDLGGFPYHPIYSGGDAEWVVSSSYAACIKTSSSDILKCQGWNVTEPSWDTGGTPLPAGGGHYAMCILTAEGNVDCMNNGHNNVGQTAGYSGGDAIDTDAQFDWSCAVTSGGDVRCWGRENHSIPFTTWAYTGVDAVSVSVGNNNICWADSSGVITCTGNQPDEYVGGGPPADITPPEIASVTADPSELWPPNHKMRSVTVSVAASDDSGEEPSCLIYSVSDDETNDTADWDIYGALNVDLRAEWDGKGDGRVYTVAVECTDGADNSSRSTVEVTVPHDQGKKKGK